MGYDMNLINYLPLSTTQPHHLLLTHCENDGNDHRELITASSEELGDRKNNDFPAAMTSRWNPTPEQITTLEEIYRSRIRTPTTDEIQEIASKLKKYGRIEGKNVFYWFQNHKARERLKRRRSEGGGDPTNKPHKDEIKDSSSGAQHELGLSNYNSDNINVNDEDHGTTEESERVSEDGKDATWRNLVNWSIIQEPGEITMDEYVNGEEEEETREIRTLNLFPVIEKQDQTGRFTAKTKEQMCCNYCYFYEFLPLKN